MTRRPWTKKELLYLKENYFRLKTISIARHLGRTPTSVRMAAIRYGLVDHHTPRSVWEPQLRKYHRQGLSDTQIAAKLDCWDTCVRKRRLRLGLPQNIHHRSPHINKVPILHRKGYSDGEMAFILDLEISTARSLRRRLGLKANPLSGRPRVKWTMANWKKYRQRGRTA